MPTSKKFKSVGVDIATYNMLQKLAEKNDRYVGQEIKHLTKIAYNEKFGDDVRELGIGSAKS